MKLTALLLFSFTITIQVAIAQSYPFARHFVEGTVTLKDSTQQKGQIKWFPHQVEKLHYRLSEKDKAVKYAPQDIAGFSTATLQFASLQDFELYGDRFALLGKMSKVKQTFGEVLDTGLFNIYLVLYTGSDALAGGVQTYANIIFQRNSKDQPGLIAFPLAIRMKANRYDQAKEKLAEFFKDYPGLVTQIQAYQRENDFMEIVEAVKKVNRQ